MASRSSNRLLNLPQVDKTTLSEKDEVTAARHRVTIDLGLDVDDRLRVGLQPGDIDLDVEVSNAKN